MSGPNTGSARIRSTIGVSVAPGATELSRMPAPAHSAFTPSRRAHQASAAFVDG